MEANGSHTEKYGGILGKYLFFLILVYFIYHIEGVDR